MTWKKRVLLVALAVAFLGIAAFALMAAKDRTYVPSAPCSPQGEPNRDVAVVYYSRSAARGRRSRLGHREVACPAVPAYPPCAWSSRWQGGPSLPLHPAAVLRSTSAA